MRPLMVVLLATAISIPVAMTSANQTQNTSDVPDDFWQGFNSALNINVTQFALDNCAGTYLEAVYFTGMFFKDLFVNWNVDFALIEGIFGKTLESFLEDWKDTCLPIADEYENYFQKAIYAYQENKEAFFATVEANFEANEENIIEFGIGIVRLIKAREYTAAGYYSGLVLKVLLSQYLPTN